MKRAAPTRYPKKNDSASAESSSSKRKGFSTTVTPSDDGRRRITKSKAVDLERRPAPPETTQESRPQSALLASMLEDVRRRASARDNIEDLNTRDFEQDFYDTNAGGYDDDYVPTNNDDGVDVEATGEAMCGVNEEGQVIQLTEEDGRRTRHFASVSLPPFREVKIL